jgi:hypothetical protein
MSRVKTGRLMEHFPIVKGTRLTAGAKLRRRVVGSLSFEYCYKPSVSFATRSDERQLERLVRQPDSAAIASQYVSNRISLGTT